MLEEQQRSLTESLLATAAFHPSVCLRDPAAASIAGWAISHPLYFIWALQHNMDIDILRDPRDTVLAWFLLLG